MAEASLPVETPQTKVSLSEGIDASGNLKIAADWETSGESFTVMTAASTSSEKFTQIGGSSFEGDLLTSWAAPYYAFYPATSSVNATSVAYDFSSQKGTLEDNDPYMYASSYGGVLYNFKHLTALVKMKVEMPSGYSGTPASITVSSARLASKGTVDITGTSPVFTSSVNTVVLPSQKAAQTSYTVYVYVNPMTASSSDKNTINVTLSDAQTTYSGSFSTSVNIQAGKAYTATVTLSKTGDSTITKLDSPSDLFVEQISETQVRFTWKDNADDESCYRIYKKEPNGEGTADDVLNTADIAANSTSYTSGVVAGKAYDFGIQARSSVAEANSTIEYYGNYTAMTWLEMQKFNADYHPVTGEFTGTYRECGAPQNLTWTQDSNTSCTITWTCWSSVETGFHIYVRPVAETAWKESHRVGKAKADATSYTITGLTAGAAYVFAVQTAGETELRNSAIVEVGEHTMEAAKSNVVIAFNGDPVVNFNFIGLGYKITNSTAQYPAHGICFSSDHTPTIDDDRQQGPTFATSGVRTAFQVLPNILFEEGKTYRFRAYVYDHLTDTYCYSEEKTIALTGEPGSISVTSSPVTSSSLNSAIKVYSFTAKGGAGQTIKGHYAVADCSSSSSVCFKVLNPSSTKLITAQASGATGCQVLVNGTIFGAKHNLGVVVQNGSHTQEWISELCSYYGEVSSDYQAITRAVLGVDASGNPSAYWVSRPSSSATYYYDRPIPAMAETDSYPMADTTFPDTPVSWNPYQALSCGPMLVFDGRVMVSSSYSSTYASYYNNYEIWGWKTNNIYASTRARTAVGYMPDGRIVLLVCDETGGSGGAKLPDVARIMQGLGCESAMNLDGGGSSAMWVKGKAVVNSWSDTDRPVRATCGFFLR